MKIGFIGLGLIGGSIAKTIKKKLPEHQIFAYDIDREGLKLALSEGVADEISTVFTTDFFKGTDILFLCAPVHSNTEYLPLLKEILSDTAILTDVGSVKTEIFDLIKENGLEKWFVGGHPMAGSEKSGYKNSNDHLIENAYYILTPSEKVDNKKTETMFELTKALGSIPLVLTPASHDYATAAISHLPHIIAASLVNLVKHSDDENGTMKMIAAGGFKDITRIASSSPEMWKQISLVNKDNISRLLSDYIDYLMGIKTYIDDSDGDNIYSMFEESRDYRNSFIDASPGPIKKAYVIYCDIIDESGAIATISTILATKGINIKNIGIIHSREYIDGALRIEFENAADMENAAVLLEKHRYRIYKK